MKKVMVLMSVLPFGRGTYAQDSTSLLYALKNGKTSGSARYFFMATDNSPGLADYYANALGGGIKYETAPLRGFQFGVSSYFAFNIGSANLSDPDPETNKPNRYEVGLFDIEDPHNKAIIRLNELYVKYSWKQSYFAAGKQQINTPFINPQDSRMLPTEVSGVYSEMNLNSTRIEGGFLYEISPRSTTHWFKAAESIGVFPKGVNPDGSASGYEGNLQSKGVALLGVSKRINAHLSAKVSDVLADNIFNAMLLQVDYSTSLKDGSRLIAGLQYVRQDAVNEGGNKDPVKTYIPAGAKSNSFGARLGWEKSHWQASLNYNRITADGRYLVPREWGREPFFTYLPRERNEGLGDVHAFVMQAGIVIPKLGMKIQSGIGYYNLPEVTDFVLNKYNMPSYIQMNMDVRHEFTGVLKGLESHLLFVYKGRAGNTYGNEGYVINKVDMSSWNLVFNYNF